MKNVTRDRGRKLPRHSVRVSAAYKALTMLLVLLLIAGIGLIAYPTVSDWWNQYHQSRAVAAYIKESENIGPSEAEIMLAQAEQYNAKLAAEPQSDRFDRTDERVKEYESTLDITGTGIMGYVTIPSIRVRLPIYHGTDDAVLQIAVGHMFGTSLPVGGDSSHAVVSGHTGLPSAKLLTELDRLQDGDIFQFHVLNRTYTYQVDQITVVLPKDLENIQITPDKDYATLVTCTPYGVNTHRLLVRGYRIPNPTTPDTTDYELPLRIMRWVAVGLGLLILVMCIVLIVVQRLRKRKSTAENLAELSPLDMLSDFTVRVIYGTSGQRKKKEQ